jgi:hypothetical protein
VCASDYRSLQMIHSGKRRNILQTIEIKRALLVLICAYLQATRRCIPLRTSAPGTISFCATAVLIASLSGRDSWMADSSFLASSSGKRESTVSQMTPGISHP